MMQNHPTFDAPEKKFKPGKTVVCSDGTQYLIQPNGSWKRITARRFADRSAKCASTNNAARRRTRS